MLFKFVTSLSMCFGDGYSGGVFRAYPFGDLAASSPLAAKCILYTSVYYLAAWTRNPSPPKVSVLTLISLFRILRARLPSHHLPTLISDHLSTKCWLLVWCFPQGCCMLIKSISMSPSHVTQGEICVDWWMSAMEIPKTIHVFSGAGWDSSHGEKCFRSQ